MAQGNKRARGRSRKRRRAGATVRAASTTSGATAGTTAAAGAHTPEGAVAGSARPAAGASRGGSASSRSAQGARRKRQRRRTPRRGGGGGLDTLLPVGQRPPAPWHPLPLSELMILFGAIGAFVALARGPESNVALLAVGLAAVAIGTVEVTLREHLSGYRSHTIVLSVLPVIVLDTVVVLLVAPFGSGVKVAILVADVAVVAILYRVLRARFLDARRERVFSEGR